MKTILIAVLLLQCIAGFTQTDSVKNLIDNTLVKVMGEVRQGNRTFYRDVNRLLITYPEYAVRKLKEYEYDTSDLVIENISNKYRMLKHASKEQSFRKKITFELLEIYRRRKNYLNNYNAYRIPSSLSDLESTTALDFDKKAKDLLAVILQDSLISRSILKAVGIAAMQDQIPELRKFLPEGERYRKPKSGELYFFSGEWYARLAMARMGDTQQIDFCVDKIENSEDLILSNSYAAARYFENMVYIKKPEVLPFLFKILADNKEFLPGSIYLPSSFAANALYRLLKGFPHNPGVVRYSDKGLKKLTKWVRKNRGKYEFKD